MLCRAVLWNEEDSMWYDYNYKTNSQNRYNLKTNFITAIFSGG
jgi:neutral trehalase